MLEDTAMTLGLRTYVEESAPIVALRLDARDQVVEANLEARRLLRGGGVGRAFADLLVEFTRPADLTMRVRQGGGVHRFTLDTASGVPESLDFRFFPLADGTLVLGSPDFREQQALRAQVLGLNAELNARTRQLHVANAELRELNELKIQFLGMAAHDLRQPISIVLTSCQIVLDETGAELSTEQREFLRSSVEAAMGMKQVIDSFLDLAVIESGQLRLDLMPATALQIIQGVVPPIRFLTARKQVELQVEACPDPRQLWVDAGKLQQVLLNLVGNAVEHSERGQRIWLAAHWEARDLVFSIRDEGPGLAPAEQAKLFTPFGRGTARKTAGERSTGLGLAIARLVIEAHGGRIWVESNPGQGATFLFSLPDQPPELK